MHVLVPLDGSKTAVNALKHVAARRRRGEKVKVTVINVQPDFPPSRHMSRETIKAWQKDGFERATSSTEEVRKLIRSLKADVKFLLGAPAETIVRFAKKARCNEIVMATQGTGTVAGRLLGSVASKVVQLTDLPTTLVH